MPLKTTLVPLARLVRSRVVPAGTAMLLRVMVEQDFLFLIASAALVKVQLSRLAGAAMTEVAASATVAREVKRCMLRD